MRLLKGHEEGRFPHATKQTMTTQTTYLVGDSLERRTRVLWDRAGEEMLGRREVVERKVEEAADGGKVGRRRGGRGEERRGCGSGREREDGRYGVSRERWLGGEVERRRRGEEEEEGGRKSRGGGEEEE